MKSRHKKFRYSLRAKESTAGVLFSLPFIFGFVFFFLSPITLYVVMAFSSLSLNDAGDMVFKFIGLENFNEAFFVQKDYLKNIFESLGELLVTFPSILLYSLFVAIILNQKFKGRTIARAIFFLPVIIASGVAAIGQSDALTSTAINAISGVSGATNGDTLNLTESVMGIIGATFDSSFFTIIGAIINKIYFITMNSGVQILIFLAGLQSISPSLYEASSVEGCTAWENFWKITFPMISPLILVNSIYTIIDVLGNTDNTIVNSLYRLSILESKYGLSSAMGFVYFVVIFAILGVAMFLISKIVFYEDR